MYSLAECQFQEEELSWRKKEQERGEFRLAMTAGERRGIREAKDRKKIYKRNRLGFLKKLRGARCNKGGTKFNCAQDAIRGARCNIGRNHNNL